MGCKFCCKWNSYQNAKVERKSYLPTRPSLTCNIMHWPSSQQRWANLWNIKHIAISPILDKRMIADLPTVSFITHKTMKICVSWVEQSNNKNVRLFQITIWTNDRRCIQWRIRVCEEINAKMFQPRKLCSTLLFRRKLGENMPEEIVHRFEDKWAICRGLMGTGRSASVCRRILKHIEKCGFVTNCTLECRKGKFVNYYSVCMYHWVCIYIEQYVEMR